CIVSAVPPREVRNKCDDDAPTRRGVRCVSPSTRGHDVRSNLDRIRLFVFRIWFLTLAVVLLTFAEKLSGLRNLSPPFGAVFQSFQMMIGLVVPQIGMMAAFYLTLERQKEKLQSLSADQVSIITWLSIAYHLLFIVAVVFGIVFYGFDRQADGQALQRNSA